MAVSSKTNINRSPNRRIVSEFTNTGGLNTVDVHNMSSSFFVQALNVNRSEMNAFEKRPGYTLESAGPSYAECDPYEPKTKVISGITFTPAMYYAYESGQTFIKTIDNLTQSEHFKENTYNIKLTERIDKVTKEKNWFFSLDNNIEIPITYKNSSGAKSYTNSIPDYKGESQPIIYAGKVLFCIGDIRDVTGNKDHLPLVAFVPIATDASTFKLEAVIVSGRDISAAEHSNNYLGPNIGLENPNDSVVNVQDAAVTSTLGLVNRNLKTPEIGDTLNFEHIYAKPTEVVLKAAWKIIGPDGAVIINDYDENEVVTNWRSAVSSRFLLTDAIKSTIGMAGKYSITSSLIDDAYLTTSPPPEGVSITAFYHTSYSEVMIDPSAKINKNINEDVFTCRSMSLDTNYRQIMLHNGIKDPQRIYYLNNNDVEYVPLYQFFDIVAPNHDRITCIYNYGKDLMIFGEKYIHQYSGSSTSMVSSTFGLLAPATVIYAGFGVMFLSNDGLKVIMPSRDNNNNYYIKNMGYEVSNKIKKYGDKNAFAYLYENQYYLAFPNQPINDYVVYDGLAKVKSPTFHVLKYNTVLQSWLEDNSIIFEGLCGMNLRGMEKTILTASGRYRLDKDVYTDGDFQYDVIVQPHITNLDNTGMTVKPKFLYLGLYNEKQTDVKLSVEVINEAFKFVTTDEYNISKVFDDARGSTQIKRTLSKVSNIEIKPGAFYDVAEFDDDIWDRAISYYYYSVNLYQTGKNSTFLNFILSYRGDSFIGYTGGYWIHKYDKVKTRGGYRRG